MEELKRNDGECHSQRMLVDDLGVGMIVSAVQLSSILPVKAARADALEGNNAGGHNTSIQP